MNGNRVGERTLAYLRGERDLFAERERLAAAKKVFKDSSLGNWLAQSTERRTRRFWDVVGLLQEDSRMGLTKMGRKLGVSASTLYDDVKHIRKFFRFTIVLKEEELGAIGSSFSFYYELDEGCSEPKDAQLSAYI
jgi:hypothetical protein